LIHDAPYISSLQASPYSHQFSQTIPTARKKKKKKKKEKKKKKVAPNPPFTVCVGKNDLKSF
jgi:hypothetical protein